MAIALGLQPSVDAPTEPTNRLEVEAVEKLEEELSRRRSPLLLIAHDRTVLCRLPPEFWNSIEASSTYTPRSSARERRQGAQNLR